MGKTAGLSFEHVHGCVRVFCCNEVWEGIATVLPTMGFRLAVRKIRGNPIFLESFGTVVNAQKGSLVPPGSLSNWVADFLTSSVAGLRGFWGDRFSGK